MNILELKEKRMSLLTQVADITKRENFSAEDKVQADKILDEVGRLDTQIRGEEARELAEAEAVANELRTKKSGGGQRDEMAEFRHFIATGENRAAATQTVTTTAGGYLIPEGFKSDILKAFLSFGGMYQVSNVFKTPTGNDIQWPTNNDTGNKAFQININTSPEDSGSNTALTFGQKTLKAFKWTSGLIRVPNELFEDEGLSQTLDAFVREALKERMWRGLNQAWTTAAGTTTIQGVVTGATASSVHALSTAISKDNIYDLVGQVDPAYHSNGRFMLNYSTLMAIMKLSVGTSDDRPLWQPSVRDGAPDTILGFPYTINQDVASIAASAKSLLFGDFKYYIIREVADWRLVRLVERFADSDQVGVTLFARYDGQVADGGTHPIKYLTHSAT